MIISKKLRKCIASFLIVQYIKKGKKKKKKEKGKIRNNNNKNKNRKINKISYQDFDSKRTTNGRASGKNKNK